jgi:L-seryl-tRNA(Ser) seleniumtransferase
MTDPRRALPPIHELVDAAECAWLIQQYGRGSVTDAVREVLAQVRAGAATAGSTAEYVGRAHAQLATERAPSLRRVVNATGVILHTNMGRAPLATEAVLAMSQIASGYSNLEFDLATGTRGSRLLHAREQLIRLTGCEDAVVVNNCAAGLVLALRALAGGQQVLVSRGELVEIGGGFRVPEIMTQAGVELVEVGTTNRTRLDDYASAITARTGAMVKVHRSNFAMTGFVADVAVEELMALGRAHTLPVLHDFGSGLLLDLAAWGLTGEPTARDAVATGADVVIMSGDKLLGGPQCGIVLGTSAAITQLRQHPLARALRVDKLTLAALEATLALSHDPAVATQHIPVLQMITAPAAAVEARAASLRDALADHGIRSELVPHTATIGGGAFPTAVLPSTAVALTGDAERWHTGLRTHAMAVVGIARNGRCLLDARTISDADVRRVVLAAREVAA